MPGAPRAAGQVAEDAALPLPGLPGVPAGRAERRFSVVLNGATPEVVFMSLLAETPLSVAVDPSVKGPMSISLKDVTLRESLDLLRELHGLDYKVIGRHILVSAAQMQTRIFTVDYPSFNRTGRSELRVLSGSITGNAPSSSPGAGSANPNNSAGATGGGTSGGNGAMESSRISTSQRNDLWGEIETTVKLLVGDKEGRSVVVSPQTGNIVVRALPREIRAIGEYLEATRVSVQRQVMLEAKVVEVQLRDSERTGINWSAFKLGLTTRATGGVISPGGSVSLGGPVGDGLISITPGQALESAATAAGSLLGLAFQTRNFAAVLDFLGTQGNTQVLSSPRIATMNNQKAVLKVGTDDFFVTSISSTTTAVGNTTATTPNIGVQPFFSGISLDVTPNIDANGYITLHVHPSVSNVSERTKIINLGTQGSYALPLASSEINESDAVVRALDGQIIAIGGLMRQASSNSDSGVPGTEGTFWRKALGGQTNRLTEKRELVILLKPTIVDPASEDAELRRDSLQRLLDWTETQPRQPSKSTTSAPQAAPVAPRAASPAVESAKPQATAPESRAPVAVASAGSPTPPSAPLVLSWSALAMTLGDSGNGPSSTGSTLSAPSTASVTAVAASVSPLAVASGPTFTPPAGSPRPTANPTPAMAPSAKARAADPQGPGVVMARSAAPATAAVAATRTPAAGAAGVLTVATLVAPVAATPSAWVSTGAPAAPPRTPSPEPSPAAQPPAWSGLAKPAGGPGWYQSISDSRKPAVLTTTPPANRSGTPGAPGVTVPAAKTSVTPPHQGAPPGALGDSAPAGRSSIAPAAWPLSRWAALTA